MDIRKDEKVKTLQAARIRHTVVQTSVRHGEKEQGYFDC